MMKKVPGFRRTKFYTKELKALIMDVCEPYKNLPFRLRPDQVKYLLKKNTSHDYVQKMTRIPKNTEISLPAGFFDTSTVPHSEDTYLLLATSPRRSVIWKNQSVYIEIVSQWEGGSMLQEIWNRYGVHSSYVANKGQTENMVRRCKEQLELKKRICILLLADWSPSGAMYEKCFQRSYSTLHESKQVVGKDYELVRVAVTSEQVKQDLLVATDVELPKTVSQSFRKDTPKEEQWKTVLRRDFHRGVAAARFDWVAAHGTKAYTVASVDPQLLWNRINAAISMRVNIAALQASLEEEKDRLFHVKQFISNISKT